MKGLKKILLNTILFCYISHGVVAQEKEYSNSNKIIFAYSKIKGDTLILASGGKLSDHPFGTDSLSEKAIQEEYEGIFKVDNFKDSIITFFQGKNYITIHKHQHFPQAEFLAEYHHKKLPIYYLYDAYICTPSIKLEYEIVIGMDKDTFFRLIYDFYSQRDKIRVVILYGSPPDGPIHRYFFKKNKLTLIKINSNN